MFFKFCNFFVIFGGQTDGPTDRQTDRQTDLDIKAPSRSLKNGGPFSIETWVLQTLFPK